MGKERRERLGGETLAGGEILHLIRECAAVRSAPETGISEKIPTGGKGIQLLLPSAQATLWSLPLPRAWKP